MVSRFKNVHSKVNTNLTTGEDNYSSHKKYRSGKHSRNKQIMSQEDQPLEEEPLLLEGIGGHQMKSNERPKPTPKKLKAILPSKARKNPDL